nr:GtrA family protein [uncultured Gellertiella sp.]
MDENEVDPGHWSATFWQLLRYGCTGGATFLIFLALASLPLVVPSIRQGVASGAAIFVSGIFNFAVQYAFTFQSKRPVKAAILRYLLLVSFNSLWGGALANVMVQYFGIYPVVANITCALALTAFTYPAMRFFVM